MEEEYEFNGEIWTTSELKTQYGEDKYLQAVEHHKMTKVEKKGKKVTPQVDDTVSQSLGGEETVSLDSVEVKTDGQLDSPVEPEDPNNVYTDGAVNVTVERLRNQYGDRYKEAIKDKNMTLLTEEERLSAQDIEKEREQLNTINEYAKIVGVGGTKQDIFFKDLEEKMKRQNQGKNIRDLMNLQGEIVEDESGLKGLKPTNITTQQYLAETITNIASASTEFESPITIKPEKEQFYDVNLSMYSPEELGEVNQDKFRVHLANKGISERLATAEGLNFSGDQGKNPMRRSKLLTDFYKDEAMKAVRDQKIFEARAILTTDPKEKQQYELFAQDSQARAKAKMIYAKSKLINLIL